MSNELNNDLSAWWKEQEFPGKESYGLSDDGVLSITGSTYAKAHVVATLTMETAPTVLANLQEKFLVVEARFRELEVEWLAADDKLKLTEKLDHFKEQLAQAAVVGDFTKMEGVIADWDVALVQLSKEAYDRKQKLAEMAESLADSDNWKETANAFKDIIDQWKASGHLDKHRSDKLFGRIEAARKKFQDRKRHFQEEEGKDMNNNLDLKIEIVQQAEAMANSEEWKAAAEAFHKLMDAWKAIGRTPNKKNEELWQRFMTAKNTFFDRKKVHFNDVQQEQEQNLILKSALLERAEAMKYSKDWGKTAQAYAALMEEWKKIGRVPAAKSDDLWKRFNDASDVFFEAKKRHSDNFRQQQEANYQLKQELLNRAEEIKDSTSWSDTTAEMNTLMDEWKKIGPVPKEHSNTIWEAFVSARKHFFNRKDANRDQRRQQAEARTLARADEIEARTKAKIEDAKQQVKQLHSDIQEEEEKIVDFKAAMQNITPGKKAAELTAHLEKLIVESAARLRQLKEKQSRTQEQQHAVPDGQE